jgi:alginate O-acetyltransferase complex protein AlgI
MLFSSLPFFVFFLVYLVFHVTVPGRWRLALIILGSTFFYGYWDYRFIPLPFCLLAVAHLGVWWMDVAADPNARRRRLFVTIGLLLLPLVFFKYVNFLYRDVYGLILPMGQSPVPVELAFGWTLTLFPTADKLLDVILPLGVSFVTFTFIGYAVDVYRRQEKREGRLELLASAVMFFPHLIAGPVVLPKQLMWQMESPRMRLRRRQVLAAVMIFTVGLVKKLIFADQLATMVNPVFKGAGNWSSCDYVLAVVGFSVQIYCDFSGYSDMAIGIARLLGVKLPRNFERPYMAASIVEFWQRWHITLSNWLRDYLYIPLGGNRGGIWRQVRNVMITMALGGLWHGARWTFVMWGLAHGTIIALTHLSRHWGWRDTFKKLPRPFWVVLTFSLVTLAWIPFRAETTADAWRVFSGMFLAPMPDLSEFAATRAFPLLLVFAFLLTHRYDYITRVRVFARRTPVEIGWAAIMVLLTLSVFVSAGGSADFIYFDF